MRHSYSKRKLHIHIETENLVVFFLTSLAYISDVENDGEKCTVGLTPKEKRSAPFAVAPDSPHFPLQ